MYCHEKRLFDSDLTEWDHPIMTEKGILLVYNGKNKPGQMAM